MPSLKEGIQYVGMLRPTYTEFDYIITGLNGNVDCFSKGVSNLLGISPQIFKENNSGINIMLLCPELIEVFDLRRKLIKLQSVKQNNPDELTEQENQDLQSSDPDSPFLNSKLAQPGGNPLAIIVPQNFNSIARQEKPQKQRGSSKKKHSDNNLDGSQQSGGIRSGVFQDFLKYLQKGRSYRKQLDIKRLLTCKEYKDNEKLKLVQCELEIAESRINRTETSALKYLIFKIRHPGNKSNKDIQGPADAPGQGQDEENDDVQSQGLDDEQDQLNLMKNAHPLIQEVYGPKDDSSKNGQIQVLGALKYQFQMMLFKNAFSADAPLKAQSSGTPKTGFAYLAELIAMKRAELQLQAQKKNPGEEVPPTNALRGYLESQKNVQTPADNASALPGIKQADTVNMIKQAPNFKGSSNKISSSPQQVDGMQHTFAPSNNNNQVPQQTSSQQPVQNTSSDLYKQKQTSFKTDSDMKDNDPDDSKSSISEEGDSDLNTEDYHKKRRERKIKKQQPVNSQNSGAARKLLMNLLGGPPIGAQFTRIVNSNSEMPKRTSTPLNNTQPSIQRISNPVSPVQNISSKIQAEEYKKESEKEVEKIQERELEDTPRIDVKKDISINDKIKQKTAPYQQDNKTLGLPLATINDQQEVSNVSSIKQHLSSHMSRKQTSYKPDQLTHDDNASDVEDDAPEKALLPEKIVSSQPNDDQDSAGAVFPPPEANSNKMDEGAAALDQQSLSESLEEEYEEEIEEIIEELDEDEEYEETQDVRQSGVDQTSQRSGRESQKRSMQRTKTTRETLLKGGDTNLTDEQSGSPTDNLPLQKLNTNTQGVTWMNQYNQTQTQPVVKKKKLRNYDRIVTNPKDRQHDIESCGSYYLKDWELGNDEIGIRDIIKKCEQRKLKKERRRRKQQLKSLETTQTTKPTAGGETTEDIQNSLGEDSDTNKSSADVTELDVKDSSIQEGHAEKDLEEDEISEEDNQRSQLINTDDQGGDVSSVASSMYSQMRSYFTLRDSIDEKFVPLSIQNLKTAASFVFLALLTLNITQFAIQQKLFGQVNSNIKNIHYSEMRISHIIDINLRVQNLRFLNEGLLSKGFLYGMNESAFRQVQNDHLIQSATALEDSQTSLSLATSTFDYAIRQKINPSTVVLQYDYQPIGGLKDPIRTQALKFNIWESVIKIVASVYQLASTPERIITTDTLVKFVQENCLNSLLGHLKESTQAIILATNSIRDSSLAFFLYLLIAVSCALLISVAFLLPIISRAKQSKQSVLELFLHKKIERAIDDQLRLCRWFITKYQVRPDMGNLYGGGGGLNGDQGAAGADGAPPGDSSNTAATEAEIKKEKEELYTMKKQKKKKKWRKLNIGFGYLSLRLLLIVAILETFYLVSYLVSNTFMNEVTDLTSELRLLISRQPLYMLVLLAQKELFYTNGTSQILSKNVREVLAEYNKQLIDDEQKLLELFSANLDFHTSSYNSEFNQLIYSSICDKLDILMSEQEIVQQQLGFESPSLVKEECSTINVGVLQKGLYSTVTKYLSSLKQIDSQFLLLRKVNETAKNFINDPKIILSERTCDVYMNAIHSHLVHILEDDINTFFQKEQKQDIAIFIIFLAYLFFIYFFVWRIFVSNLLDELWKAKSMLSILPIDLCFKIEDIRLFIYANSSSSKVK